ncbi:MAG TPA: 5-formyltetrahydrofolate cyclo-ligase [Microthrixaceae bacterium]|nr:5-formyltetrahydrofolate cyclo-ligase [Microthrixaceae bacterium]
MSDAGSDSSNEIRIRNRALRRSIGDAQRADASAMVSEAISNILGSRRPGRIATYMATDGEIDPAPLRTLLEPLGWQFHLPVIEPLTAERLAGSAAASSTGMTFRRWSPDMMLVPNRFGIMEPDESSPAVAVADLDVVIVPSVALDLGGNRIGMGAGYYDRAMALPKESRPELIGVVFEAQLVPRIETNEWDIPVDVIVTEGRSARAG